MDVVTGIRELQNGVRVTVNDRLTLLYTRGDWKAEPLNVGDAVNVSELRQALLLRQYPRALNRAVRLLAVRARSGAEIEKRLNAACFLDETVDMVLLKLQTEGLLDDRTFAEQWARERSARQIGKARILQELRQKGIDGALAERAVAEINEAVVDESAKQLAGKLLKRYAGLPAAEALRKAVAAMQRRGYGYGDAVRALGGSADGGDMED